MGGAKARYDGIKAFSETDFTDDLKAIEVPTLLMHGDDDQIVPIDDSARIGIGLLKRGELKVYPGLPHGMATVNADTINADLLAFIEGWTDGRAVHIEQGVHQMGLDRRTFTRAIAAGAFGTVMSSGTVAASRTAQDGPTVLVGHSFSNAGHAMRRASASNLIRMTLKPCPSRASIAAQP